MRVLLSTYGGVGMSNRWWDWRCGCGHSARRCGVRAAGLGGAAVPVRRAAGPARRPRAATRSYRPACSRSRRARSRWPKAGHPVCIRGVLSDLSVIAASPAAAAAGPDERPLPAELEAFLDNGTPPVYAGFGSMRAPKDIARAAIEAIRAQGRRAVFAAAGPISPHRRPGRLHRRRRGQPAATVPPGGRRRPSRRRGHVERATLPGRGPCRAPPPSGPGASSVTHLPIRGSPRERV
jgi:hypothetical protein